jgi:hypothetical protein
MQATQPHAQCVCRDNLRIRQREHIVNQVIAANHGSQLDARVGHPVDAVQSLGGIDG